MPLPVGGLFKDHAIGALAASVVASIVLLQLRRTLQAPCAAAAEQNPAPITEEGNKEGRQEGNKVSKQESTKESKAKEAIKPSLDAVHAPSDEGVQAEASEEPSPVPLVMLTDPGQDMDDEMALIMSRHLVHLKMVELRGVISTLAPSFARARLARGTLDLLGLHHVPVGIGSDGGDIMGKHTAEPFEESAASYMPGEDSGLAHSLEPGRRVLRKIYAQAKPHSLVLLVIASAKDAALFLRDNREVACPDSNPT
eukprot:6399229-Prymnesium_polylepis.1